MDLQRGPDSLTNAGCICRLRCKAVSQGGIDGGAEARAGRRGARRPRVPRPCRLIDCRPLQQSTLPLQQSTLPLQRQPVLPMPSRRQQANHKGPS